MLSNNTTIHDKRYEALRFQMRGLRRAAGLTQAELAARLNVDQSSVSKIERGERFVDIFFYLDWCRACRTEPPEAVADLIKAGA
jgi:transcriptional regulator with XRE-family HTH domain